MRKKIIVIILTIIFCNISAFPQYNNDVISSTVQLSNEGYYIGNNGEILINVNLWGFVKSPGNYLVHEGIDLVNLLSIAGGPLDGANLKKIKLLRSEIDSSGNKAYILNLEKYYKHGDKADFVSIFPNDTIIIEETMLSSIFRSSNMLTTLLQILNISLAINNK